MVSVPIILSGIWVALMLTYLQGDVLRITSGDLHAPESKATLEKMNGKHWMGIAILMLVPIAMVVLSLILPQPVSRWANIVVAILLFIFNLFGLPTYRSAYDRFLIAAGLVFNALTVWYAWGWL